MKKNKATYERPKCDVLVVRLEDSVLNSISSPAKGGIQHISEDDGDVTDDSNGWIQF